MSSMQIEEKINAYGKPVGIIKTYMNLFVWVMVLLFGYSEFDVLFGSGNYSTYETLRIITLCMWALFAAIVIRDLDKFGMYVNIGLLIAWPVSYAVSLALAFRSIGLMAGEVAASAGELAGFGPFGGLIAGAVSGGVMVGTQIAFLIGGIRLLIIAAVCGGFAWELHKHRDLFIHTTKELQE